MLEVVDLSCVRGDRRLFSEVGFTLDRGELLYVHGHNGSGKNAHRVTDRKETAVDVSVVIPIHNEHENIPLL